MRHGGALEPGVRSVGRSGFASEVRPCLSCCTERAYEVTSSPGIWKQRRLPVPPAAPMDHAPWCGGRVAWRDSESVASNAGTSADVRVCDYPDVPNLPDCALAAQDVSDLPDCALEAQGAQHLPDSPVAGGGLYMNNDEAFAGGRASG